MRRIGTSAVCLHEVPSAQPLRVTIAPTTVLPLPNGAFGQALLAFAPDDVLDEVIAQESAMGTSSTDPDRLRADLAEIVARAWRARSAR